MQNLKTAGSMPADYLRAGSHTDPDQRNQFQYFAKVACVEQEDGYTNGAYEMVEVDVPF